MYNNFSSKKTKKVISALLATALVATSAPISADAATTKVVGVGKTITYNAKATVKKVTVKNKKIVTAKKSGKKVTIKGKKAGKTTVTVKTTKKTIKLTVKVGATKITKKTVTTSMVAGTTKALKVNAVNGKGDTIKFTSSNKAIVKVNKASAVANKNKVAGTTVTALKAGTAKIKATSKYTGKSKTFTITVVDATPTVTPSTNPAIVATTPAVTATNAPSNPGVSTTTNAPSSTNAPGSTDVANTNAPETKETPAPEETAAPTSVPTTATQGAITVYANVAGATVKVTSNGAVVYEATMDATDNNIVSSLLKNGTYTIEVSKDGYDTVTDTIVVAGSVVYNATLSETKQVGAKGYVQNQLIGYDDTVLVNDSAIVIINVKDQDSNPLANQTVVLSLANTKKTGAKADFEIKGNSVVTTDANGNASFVVGQKDTVTDATDADYVGSIEYKANVIGTEYTTSGSVGFAAIEVGGVSSVDFAKANLGNIVPGSNVSGSAIATTTNLNNDRVQYDIGQQVSTAGTDEHALTFSVTPKIVLPAMSNSDTTAKNYHEEINLQSGEYHTYASDSKTIKVSVDTTELSYASLNFNKLVLSPYTQLTVAFYSDAACTTANLVDDKTLGGGEYGLNQENFALQIPLTKGTAIKTIKLTLESAGEVETDMNAGYDISDITGIYQASAAGTAGTTVAIKGATVEWKAVKPTFSEIKSMSVDAAEEYGIDTTDVKTVEYQVPVFPYTGNAVITTYNKNNEVVSYYLLATEKSNATDTKNTNVLKDYTVASAYKATDAEVKNIITTGVTQDGNNVVVNSETVGSTTLEGTLNLSGLGSDLMDDANSKVYTSIQWNPVPAKAETTDASAFVAIAGQKITVTAQLTDKNGNAATTKGVGIDFKSDYLEDVTTVKKSTTTDAKGQATLVLQSSEAAAVLDLVAEASTSSGYNVQLYIGDTAVDKADLYWVNAGLKFTDKITGGTTYTVTSGAVDAKAQDPTVGTPWEYAVKAVGSTVTGGALEGYTIDIDGLKIDMTANEDNKGTYKVIDNGVMAATSDYKNTDKLVARISENSVSGDITFTAKKTGKDDIIYKSVGEGTPNINAKMNLSVDWQAKGTTMSIITPQGTNIGAGTTTLYIKVTDGTGKNPWNEGAVTLKTSSGTLDTTSATPDENGIVAVTLTKGGESNSIITATIEGVSQVASTTINWVAADTKGFDVLRARTVEDSDNKQIEVTYNGDVCAESLNVEEFTLTSYDDNADKTKTYEIKSATASGNKVILTLASALAADEYTISVDPYKTKSVTYQLANESGTPLAASKIKFYSTTTAKYEVSASGNKIVVSNIKTPVDFKYDNNETDTLNNVLKNNVVVTVGGKKVALDNLTISSYKKADGTACSDGDAIASFEITSGAESIEGKTVAVYYMGGYDYASIAGGSTGETDLETKKSDAEAKISAFNTAVATVNQAAVTTDNDTKLSDANTAIDAYVAVGGVASDLTGYTDFTTKKSDYTDQKAVNDYIEGLELAEIVSSGNGSDSVTMVVQGTITDTNDVALSYEGTSASFASPNLTSGTLSNDSEGLTVTATYKGKTATLSGVFNVTADGSGNLTVGTV